MDVKYRNNELTLQERMRTIEEMDRLISQYADSIPAYHEMKLEARKGNVPIKSLAKVLETIYYVGEFTVTVIADCAVAQKFFLLSSSRYEKAFARGKLKIILNEGFKKIYGFNYGKKPSERTAKLWGQISEHVFFFPESLKAEHSAIQAELEKYSKDKWWVDERNYETHLDVEALYELRQEDIIEAKVIMESMELIQILLRLHDFVTKLHRSYCETLFQQYIRQQDK